MSTSVCAAASSRTASRSVRSAGATSPEISLARSARTSPRRPERITWAPALASSRAIAWPRPPVAPVSSTRLPVTFMARRVSRRAAACVRRDGRSERSVRPTSGGPFPTALQDASARPRLHEGNPPTQDANTATVAVKPCRKFSPPTGPISPAAKNPAVGMSPSAPATALGVVVGQAEHPAPAAVAGEHQRAGRGVVAERPPAQRQRVVEVAVGRGRVARVDAHDLALLDRRADRDRARSPGRRPGRCARESRRGGARRRRPGRPRRRSPAACPRRASRAPRRRAGRARRAARRARGGRRAP